MRYLKIAGIDPGKTGAMTIYYLSSTTGEFYTMDMIPKANFVDVSWMPESLSGVEYVVVERAQAMPKQGVVSMFNYGVGFGQILGVLEAIKVPYVLITPQQWRKYHELPGGKLPSVQLAESINPSGEFRTKRGRLLHGRSDSLLIAVYGAELYRNQVQGSSTQIPV